MTSTNSALIAALLVCLVAGPVMSISPWFTASYTDMHLSFRRFAYCVPLLEPLRSAQVNETQFLVKQVSAFLTHANYDTEQLNNITEFLDKICDKNANSYAISNYINASEYGNSTNLRCEALEKAFTFMYPIFKSAATNKSEKLDFSEVIFYTPSANESEFYNLTDLINTAWIKSNVNAEVTCEITDSIKEFIANKTSTMSTNRRESDSRSSKSQSLSSNLRSVLDTLLERIFSIQRRAYWETTTRLEQLYGSVGWTANALGRTVRGARDLILGQANSTANALNSTTPTQGVTNTRV